MTRKRKIKLMMACGFDRNDATKIADNFPGVVIECAYDAVENPFRFMSPPAYMHITKLVGVRLVNARIALTVFKKFNEACDIVMKEINND